MRLAHQLARAEVEHTAGVGGPGGLNIGSNDSNSPVASGSGSGSGQTCAEGWKLVGGQKYTSVGLPCEQVS